MPVEETHGEVVYEMFKMSFIFMLGAMVGYQWYEDKNRIEKCLEPTYMKKIEELRNDNNKLIQRSIDHYKTINKEAKEESKRIDQLFNVSAKQEKYRENEEYRTCLNRNNGLMNGQYAMDNHGKFYKMHDYKENSKEYEQFQTDFFDRSLNKKWTCTGVHDNKVYEKELSSNFPRGSI